MSFIFNNNDINLMALNVKNIIECHKNTNEIEKDIKYISKKIQCNILKGDTLFYDNNIKYYAAVFAEIYLHQLILSMHNITFIKLNIESYRAIRQHDKSYTYDLELPLTNKDLLSKPSHIDDDLLIAINIQYNRFIKLNEKLGYLLSLETNTIYNSEYSCSLNLLNRFLNSVVSSNKPSSTYNNFNSDFDELYQISQNIWNIMTDIFPYMMKTSYAFNHLF